MVTKTQIDKCVEIARNFEAKRLVLFGSALSDSNAARDLDFLVEGVRGWKIYEMASQMEMAVGLGVDLIPIDTPSRFVDHNLKEGRELLAA